MSPPLIEFYGVSDNNICQNVTVKTYGELNGKIFVCRENEMNKNLKNCNIDVSKSNYKITFPDNLIVDGTEIIEVCVNSKTSGERYALLLYKFKNKPAQVGIWLKINFEKSNVIKMTGSYLKVSKMNGNLLIPTSLFIALIILLIIYKRKKEK
jgi:hypothetical protein